MIFNRNRRDLNLIPEEQQVLKVRKLKLLAAVFIVVVVLVESVCALTIPATSKEANDNAADFFNVE